MEYKFKINQKDLTSFFLDPNPSIEAFKAVEMVVTIVVIKHFSAYSDMIHDFTTLCQAKLFETRERYDPSFSAYNYSYTKVRNEIGNYIRKQREVIVEDILPLTNASTEDQYLSIPPEISKFIKYLTGEKSTKLLEIKQKEAVDLSLFILKHSSVRKVKLPSYVTPDTLYLLYKLLCK